MSITKAGYCSDFSNKYTLFNITLTCTRNNKIKTEVTNWQNAKKTIGRFRK